MAKSRVDFACAARDLTWNSNGRRVFVCKFPFFVYSGKHVNDRYTVP